MNGDYIINIDGYTNDIINSVIDILDGKKQITS